MQFAYTLALLSVVKAAMEERTVAKVYGYMQKDKIGLVYSV
jgi:hypothetical protein